MFYELKTTSSMAKIRKSDAAVTSLIDVFGKEYLLQEDANPFSLFVDDGNRIKAVVPDREPRILHSSEKRLSAVFQYAGVPVSVSYTVDEDGLGISFMADDMPKEFGKLCVAVNLKSFSNNENGSDYRIIFADKSRGVKALENGGSESHAEFLELSDTSFEISSCFNGHGAEFKLAGKWDMRANADKLRVIACESCANTY